MYVIKAAFLNIFQWCISVAISLTLTISWLDYTYHCQLRKCVSDNFLLSTVHILLLCEILKCSYLFIVLFFIFTKVRLTAYLPHNYDKIILFYFLFGSDWSLLSEEKYSLSPWKIMYFNFCFSIPVLFTKRHNILTQKHLW